MFSQVAQTGIILFIARYQFKVPTHGSFALLLVASLVFIVANLALGIMISTVAKNQKQALQLAVFVMLPSILLSEFMFPFKGMPGWAQAIGECLPVTHFIRITRGVMLKGTGFADVGLELWPVLLFTVVVVTVAIKRYRKTLD